MTSSLDAALSGMIEQQRNIELIANNLANVNTTAYKRALVHFKDVLNSAQILAAINGDLPAAEASTGSGVAVSEVERVFTQGGLLQTQQPFDLAILGAGFFRVLLEDGTIAYTRSGIFSLDANRQLVTPEGLRLDPQLALPETFTAVRVEPDGKVVIRRPYSAAELAALASDEPRDGVEEEAGRIALTRFDNPGGLLAIGGGLFRATAETPPIDGFPLEDGMGSMVGGYLEASNVELADEMSALLIATRAYQMNLQAYRTIQKLLEEAAQLA